MSEVIVSIYGGLGNQLFQYSAGRSLANKTGSTLILETSLLNLVNESSGITKRDFALQPFKIDATVKCMRDLSLPLSKTMLRLYKKMPFVHRIIYSGYCFYPEKAFEFDSNLFFLNAPIWINGHWQSYKYFSDISSIIRNEIGEVGVLGPKSRYYLERITNSDSVAIHIRRGDYITNPSAAKMHGVCSLDYYIKGLQLVTKGMKSPHCFVFSDDPEWARQNFKINYNSTVVDINDENRAHEDLWLMSACKNFVIANSTFSWWGAWLGDHNDKVVVAPKNWFLSSVRQTSDLLPEDWIKI